MNRVAFSFGMGTALGMFIGQNHSDKVEFLSNSVTNRIKANPSGKDPLASAESLLAFASTTATKNKFAVLSTLNAESSENAISSRTVQPFPVEFEKNSPVIYFNTNKLTRKVADLEKSDEVSLTYLNQSDMSCISFSGKCERVPYPESTKHWEDWLYMFYPEGNDESAGSRFSTWRVVPSRITVVSFPESVTSTRKDNRPPELVYNSNTEVWEMVCNGRDDKEDRI